MTGQVYFDADLSLRKEDVESGLEHRIVFLDLDGNGALGAGEPVRQTDAEGRFAFENLAPGSYTARLYNGTESQHLVSPWHLAQELTTPLADPFALGQADHVGTQGESGAYAYTVAGNVVTQVDLATQATESIELGAPIRAFQSLGGGALLVLLDPPAQDESEPDLSEPDLSEPDGEEQGDAPNETPEDAGLVIVSFGDQSITSLSVAAPAGFDGYAAMAMARDGAGLLLPTIPPGGSGPLHSIRYDVDSAGWTTASTGFYVSSETSLLAALSGPLVLVSAPVAEGTQVGLWSTATDSMVAGSTLVLEDQYQFLAFDDGSSIAVARNASGEVHILDAANGFATLHVLADGLGPVALDGHRELLFGVRDDASVDIFDIRDGRILANVALEATVAPVSGIALADQGNRVVLRSTSSIAQLRLTAFDAHQVELGDDASTKDLLFGMYVEGENAGPVFDEPPMLEVAEDTVLSMGAPGLLSDVSDADGDEFIALPVSQPQHGSATIHPDGSFTYQPDADFNGVDAFQIIVTDGRGTSDVMTVLVQVTPVNDPPGEIVIDLDDLPEDLQAPAVIGTIDIQDVDGDTFLIWVSDPRILVDGNELILADGAQLDYETEPEIELTIEITNANDPSDTTVVTSTLLIEDTDDPPTDIEPTEASVDENVPGAVIAQVKLIDQDSSDDYLLETTDHRFIFQGRTLRLAPGVALDYEESPTVDVAVTVYNSQAQALLTRNIRVNVGDKDDAIEDILLSDETILEMVAGYSVGTVEVVDQDASAEHSLNVVDTRFEIQNGKLKLRDGIFVRRADQQEILLTLTATNPGSVRPDFYKTFVLTVLSNQAPYQNGDLPTDVDNDGQTTPLDALIVINNLNDSGPRPLADPFHVGSGERYYDVNGDGRITPLDALIIINLLNRRSLPSAETDSGGNDTTGGDGEGESPLAPPHSPSRWAQNPSGGHSSGLSYSITAEIHPTPWLESDEDEDDGIDSLDLDRIS